MHKPSREGGEEPDGRGGKKCACGAPRRWRESNVAFNIGRIASAGRRIRGGDKGDIARVEGGEGEESEREQGGARAGVAMGKFGAFEIRGGREGERKRVFRAFVG